MTAARKPPELKTLLREVRMRAERIDEPAPFRNLGDCHMFGWQCSFTMHGRRLVQKYWMGVGYVDRAGIPNRPKLEEVMDCLLSDASMADESFEDWCANFGYDTDSRKTYAAYQACVETELKLKAFLGEPLYGRCLAAERL